MLTNYEVQVKLTELLHRMGMMEQHRVFKMVQSIHTLQIFMQWHVFAVWDFMSLVKRLQREFTCFNVPWVPPENPIASRLINEINLGEESDETPSGGNASHFELYLLAMKEVGASTLLIEKLVGIIRSNIPLEDALLELEIHPAIASFIRSTINTASYGQVPEVLGSFFYGREDVIPKMFDYLLKNLTVDCSEAPIFVYYLERHIELDMDSHGPAAKALIFDILREDSEAWLLMLNAALAAVDKRVELWDALAADLERTDRELVI